MAAFGHHDLELRQFGARNAVNAVAFRLEVDRAEASDIIQNGGNERPDDDLRIADLKILREQESCGPHDWRHDLTAGGRRRLHARREVRGKAGSLHQWDRDRAVYHHVCDGTARDRAEQARAYNCDLAGPACGVPGEGHCEVHEQLAGTGALHERAEQNEDQNIGGGNGYRDAEDAFGAHVQLLQNARRLVTEQPEAVNEEYDSRQRQGETDYTPRRLEHHDDHDDRHDDVPWQHWVDAERRALVDILLVPQYVDDGCYADCKNRIVENAGRLILLAGEGRIKQQRQGHRKKDMRAAEEQRLGGPEQDYPDVIETHRECDHDGQNAIEACVIP